LLSLLVPGRPFCSCSCPPFGNERTCHVNPLHRIRVPSATDSPNRTRMACPCMRACLCFGSAKQSMRARPANQVWSTCRLTDPFTGTELCHRRPTCILDLFCARERVRKRECQNLTRKKKESVVKSACFLRRMATPAAGGALNLRDVHGAALRAPSPSPASRRPAPPPRPLPLAGACRSPPGVFACGELEKAWPGRSPLRAERVPPPARRAL